MNDLNPIQFTESQIQVIDMARRQSYDNGMTHGIAVGIGTACVCIIVSALVSNYWSDLLSLL